MRPYAEMGWYGHEDRTMWLAEWKLRVERLWRRRKVKGGSAEVTIPVYEAIQGRGRIAQLVL